MVSFHLIKWNWKIPKNVFLVEREPCFHLCARFSTACSRAENNYILVTNHKGSGKKMHTTEHPSEALCTAYLEWYKVVTTCGLHATPTLLTQGKKSSSEIWTLHLLLTMQGPYQVVLLWYQSTVVVIFDHSQNLAMKLKLKIAFLNFACFTCLCKNFGFYFPCIYLVCNKWSNNRHTKHGTKYITQACEGAWLAELAASFTL